MSGYQEALEAAGAEILAFQDFGDYQGSWYAKVNYNGEIGWITGSFGSCSVCDAFEGEFGWCDENSEDYNFRLIEFGKSYLNGILPQSYQIEILKREIEDDLYDSEDYKEILNFVEEN